MSRDLRTTLSRRRLLRGLSGLTVALTMPIWRNATVFGQDSKTPAAKRFIGMFSANGTLPGSFFPKATATDTPLTTTPILDPLSKHFAKMLVLHGVHMNSTMQNTLGVDADHAQKPGGPHMKGPGAMLTGGSLLAGSFTGSEGPAGYADRISVDQSIANQYGTKNKFPSLEFGVRIQGQEPLRYISYRGANQPNTAVDDPFKMYARIFADANLSAADLARVTAERKSVLDFLVDDITRLESRVNADDKAKLDAHLGNIRNIEQQLSSSAVQCTPLTMPGKFDVEDMASFPNVGKLQLDLMVLAHRCGLTDVSTFMWANADSWQFFPWIGVNEEHHTLSHSSDDDAVDNAKLVKINVWQSQQVAYLFDQLEAAKEADGSSLFDNTVFLWGNELGVGNTHTYKNIPWIVAGGAGGYFKMGRYLQLKDRPHNDLLVSVCNAMGMTDVKTYGIPGVCTGPINELRG